MYTLTHVIACKCGARVTASTAVDDTTSKAGGALAAFVARLAARSKGWAVNGDDVRCDYCHGPAADHYGATWPRPGARR